MTNDETPDGEWLVAWLDCIAWVTWYMHLSLARDGDTRRILIFLPVRAAVMERKAWRNWVEGQALGGTRGLRMDREGRVGVLWMS